MPPRFPLAVRSGVPGIWPAALLSLALGACHFPELSSCFQTSGCLPSLTQVPSTTDP